MSILGVSAFHHDSAAAIIKKGKIIGACQEERFTRIKYDKSWPKNSIDYLQSITNEIKTVAYYDDRKKRKTRSIIKLQFPKAEIIYFDHHECHAMSSILMTPWKQCAVMVVDTIGGSYSTSLGVYDKGKFTWLKRIPYPNSLGLFYSTATRLLGLTPLQDESQVMAAASFGKPKWSNYIEDNFLNIADNSYQLKVDLRRGVGYGTLDWDIAASVQKVLEKALLTMAVWLQKETGMTNLAYSGGVALNCVANTVLAKHSNFTEIAIQPASGDAGCALGAAALITRPTWTGPFIGYDCKTNIDVEDIADRVLKGAIVPLLHGKAEFGPRALGNRSFIALPTDENSKKLHILKGRHTDYWRPWAPICLEEVAKSYFFVYNNNYNFDMLFVSDNLTEKWFSSGLNNARLQVVTDKTNSKLAEILKITTKAGYPILINTSLNARGKPIVNTVEDFNNEVANNGRHIYDT